MTPKLLRLLAAALGLVMTAFTSPGHACSTLTPSGLAEFERYKARYLAEESDKRIPGIFHLEEEVDEEDFQARVGYIDVETSRGVRRYRIYVPVKINCGFPNYYVEDGQRGSFYLKKDDDPDPDDLEDGVIDNFGFVHFELRD